MGKFTGYIYQIPIEIPIELILVESAVDVISNILLMFACFIFRQDGVAPNFTQKPVTKQADNGRKLLFECQLTADPEPEITWFRDDVLIKAGGKGTSLINYAVINVLGTVEKLVLTSVANLKKLF